MSTICALAVTCNTRRVELEAAGNTREARNRTVQNTVPATAT
jgi:hypothetical protein